MLETGKRKTTTKELCRIYDGKIKICVPMGKMHYLLYFKHPFGYVTSMGGTIYDAYDVDNVLIAIGTDHCGDSFLQSSDILEKFEKLAKRIILNEKYKDDECAAQVNNLLKVYIEVEKESNKKSEEKNENF